MWGAPVYLLRYYGEALSTLVLGRPLQVLTESSLPLMKWGICKYTLCIWMIFSHWYFIWYHWNIYDIFIDHAFLNFQTWSLPWRRVRGQQLFFLIRVHHELHQGRFIQIQPFLRVLNPQLSEFPQNGQVFVFNAKIQQGKPTVPHHIPREIHDITRTM